MRLDTSSRHGVLPCLAARTADKWATRYRLEGGRDERPVLSAAHPERGHTGALVLKIVYLRWEQRLAPSRSAREAQRPA